MKIPLREILSAFVLRKILNFNVKYSSQNHVRRTVYAYLTVINLLTLNYIYMDQYSVLYVHTYIIYLYIAYKLTKLVISYLKKMIFKKLKSF